MKNNRCPSCSNTIPESAPAGICPKCLLQAGMVDKGSNANTIGSKGTYSVPAADSLIAKFPNLEIEYLIGYGGMGVVYKARQTNLDRVVALKILSPQLGEDPTFAERFTREAKTLAKLSHPNIVTVFDFGVADSMHYLVMEYIDGVNLRDTILATDYTSTEALAVIGQVCDALQYAHDEGVVHRDIKPENILVDRNGNVRIADFGLAKLLSPTPEEFTLTGTRQVLGTLKYMAPEQIEKPEQVDHRADLYSLGVVFYELLTGELPIGRFAVPSAKAEINRRLDDVVLKTLEKEPDNRYQQASEIKTAVAAASAVRAEPLPVEAVPVAESASPRSFVVPFTTDDIYGGMADGFGIARLIQPDTLRIEIEVRDCFGATKLALNSFDIPTNELSSIRFKSGIFWDKVTIQSDSIAAFGDIPSAKMGALNLYIKKRDCEIAKQLTMDIHNRLPTMSHSASSFAMATPTAPVKQDWNADTDEEFRDVAKQLRVPMIGLFMVGVLFLLTAIGDSIGKWMHMYDPNVELSTSIEAWGRIFGPNYFDYFIWLPWAGALFSLLAAYHLWRRNNRWMAMGSLILCCVPIHTLTVFTFALAIWGLIVIDQPAAKEVFHQPKRSRVGLGRLLMMLSITIPIFMAVGVFTLWLAFERKPATPTPAVKVTSSVQAEQSDDLNTKAEASAAEPTEIIESSTNSAESAVEPASQAEETVTVKIPTGFNHPGDTYSESPRTSYRLGALAFIGVIIATAFMLIVGLVVYLILGKPRQA